MDGVAWEATAWHEAKEELPRRPHSRCIPEKKKKRYAHVTNNVRVDKLPLVVSFQLLAANLAFAVMSRALCRERGLHRRARGVDGPHGWLVFCERTISGRPW